MFSFDILDLGLVDYSEALAIQNRLVCEVSSGVKISTLILCEHNPVITLGRQANEKNILKPQDALMKMGISTYNVHRGGDVTMHIPGQLVVYPIFSLRQWKRDLHKFLRAMEEAILLLLRGYHIKGIRKENNTGVWVGDKKIASIGISVSRWVTSHGLSLNVGGNLDLFSLIRPCGQDIMMTSMTEILGPNNVNIEKVKGVLIHKFREVFKA